MNCRQCQKRCAGMYCTPRCRWVWHNHNRTLTPNAIYDCEICGKHVEKWVSPARVKDGTYSNRFCSRACAGTWRTGVNHPQWDGGRQIDREGYVLIYCPKHPYACNRGSVREHRLIMEKKIGRYLKPSEVVHHKDGNRSNNKTSNLILFKNHAEHMKHETQTTFKRRTNGTWEKKS